MSLWPQMVHHILHAPVFKRRLLMPWLFTLKIVVYISRKQKYVASFVTKRWLSHLIGMLEMLRCHLVANSHTVSHLSSSIFLTDSLTQLGTTHYIWWLCLWRVFKCELTCSPKSKNMDYETITRGQRSRFRPSPAIYLLPAIELRTSLVSSIHLPLHSYIQQICIGYPI
jgi:hypothetical protein